MERKKVTIDGNFARGYSGGGSDSVWIYNNLIIAENAWIGFANTSVPTIETNNFLFGNFDASRLTSGVYFHRLDINDYVDVKKMIFLK